MTRREFALEIRKHWAEELLSGRKKVELRGYPLPEAVGESMIEMLFFFSRQVSLLSLSPLLVFFHNLLDNNKKPTTKGSSRVWLLATDGPAGQAALGDTIDPSEDRERAEVVGWARFDNRKEKVYRSAAEVEADSGEHLIFRNASSSSDSRDSSSVYGWREGVTEALFGWRVAEVQKRAAGKPELPPLRLAPGERLLRSVYVLERAPGEEEEEEEEETGVK